MKEISRPAISTSCSLVDSSYGQRISNPKPGILGYDPMPWISILGMGRAKLRETDSKAAPVGGRLQQTTPSML